MMWLYEDCWIEQYGVYSHNFKYGNGTYIAIFVNND